MCLKEMAKNILTFFLVRLYYAYIKKLDDEESSSW